MPERSQAFSAFEGIGDPPPFSVNIANGTAGTTLSELVVSITYSSSTGWLNATLSHTTAPAVLTLQARTTGLAAATYRATVAISAPNAGNTASISVTLLVRPGIVTLPLAQTINEYRASHGLPAIPISRSLTEVAMKHIEDLERNAPYGGVCNLHGWSNNGNWTACCYTADHAQAQCMWREPREITDGAYTGNATRSPRVRDPI